MPKKNLRDHTTREIIAFSLLPFGLLTIQTLINTALNMYLTDVLGLTLAMTGVVLSATKVWDAVNDPMMGLIVDRTRTKRGKCRPYILWTVIPVVLTTSNAVLPCKLWAKRQFCLCDHRLPAVLHGLYGFGYPLPGPDAAGVPGEQKAC